MLIIVVFLFLLSFFSCLVCLVTNFLPCTAPTCAESLLALVVLDSVALSFLFSARNTQRCMFLQELSTLGEHQYNALKSRAYHPTQHLRARGCLALQLPEWKFKFYIKSSSLSMTRYTRFFSPRPSLGRSSVFFAFRFYLLSKTPLTSPAATTLQISWSVIHGVIVALSNVLSSSPAEELQSPHHSFPQSWLLLHKYKLHRITLSDDTSTYSVKTLTDQRNGSSSG